jgi:hypothetical protein
MPALHPYSGYDHGPEPEPTLPEPSEAMRALRVAEAEVDPAKGHRAQ